MWGVDQDAPIVMAQAVTIYLAHRLDEIDNTPEHILAHAARGRVRRQPARNVRTWLADQGVSLS